MQTALSSRYNLLYRFEGLPSKEKPSKRFAMGNVWKVKVGGLNYLKRALTFNHVLESKDFPSIITRSQIQQQLTTK